jgi:copper chaperone CopZ
VFRRRFVKLMTLATAGGRASLEAATRGATNIVVFRVAGFSCITCATGLDTMLREQKGVASSKSTYPEGAVTVAFDPEQITEQAVIAFINGLGFTVEGKHQS